MALFADGSLSGGQTRNRNAVRRAGNIVHAAGLEEVDGRRIAAVFAADAQMQVGAGGTAQLGGHLHQLAHAHLIQLGEGIVLVDLLIIVSAQELAGVVTAEAEGHLSQVVGAEAEELSFFCHFVGGEASSKKTSSVANFLSWYHILEHMKNKA